MLTTKIQPPRVRTTRVARPRLIARLEQTTRHQLTLISAPAGSGKTTLLSEWLVHCSVPFAWVALDEDDNDAARFMGYCIAALRTLSPQLGETAMALLQTPEPLETALITLMNELISLQQNDFLLILDDYHLIHNQAIQRAMTFLLEHLPVHMHLVIASRTDPPLPLARLRAHDELNELRLADLRFTPDEAVYFCRQVMGLQLDPEHITTLEEHTEGWIAGLQLAALSLRTRQSNAEVATFVCSFSGRDRYVLDYLLEEVLQRLPAAIQEFLLNTSVLDRLSPSLCAAVHDQDEPPLLEELERANLFLVPLDSERCWYRYHHLFAELLRVRLRQMYPGREIILYQRAAEWYERNNMPAEAVSYALGARDFERAVHLINDIAEGMLKRGEAATVAGWLKQLPDELVRAQPLLSLAYAMTLLATSHFEQVEDYLQVAEQGLQSGEGVARADIRYLLGRVYAMRATVAINQGEHTHTIELARRALEMLPAEDQLVRGIILLNLGDACRANHDFAEAERFLQEAIVLNQTSGNVLVAVTTMGSLGELQEQRGQLRLAEQTYRQALLLSGEQGEKGGQELPSAGKAHIFLGRLLYEWNRLGEALEQVRRGIELCQQWGHTRHMLDGYLVLAVIQQARGEQVAAHATLAVAQTLAEQEQLAARKPNQALNWMTWHVAEASARLWLVQGNLARAEQWAQEQHFIPDAITSHVGSITMVRFLLARQQAAQARSLLEKLVQSAQETGALSQELQLRAMLALALHTRGESRAAAAQLVHVLERAEAEEYMRSFIDLGPAMHLLLRLAFAQSSVTPYTSRLLAAFGEAVTSETSSELSEPLNRREREILHLVAAGMSNREIAQTLVMTVGTVKWYVNSIYGKLQVRGRVQAIERARVLRLLPGS